MHHNKVRTLERRRRRTDAACGLCGYSLRGLDMLTCPECGSDLRRVGILAAAGAAREPIAFIAAAFFFSLVMFIVGWTLTTAVMDLLPPQPTNKYCVSLSALPTSEQLTPHWSKVRLISMLFKPFSPVWCS